VRRRGGVDAQWRGGGEGLAAENRSDGTKADPVRFVVPRGGWLDLGGKFKGARSRPAPNALRLVEDQSLTDQARVYGHAVRCMELIRARELTPCRATGGLKVNREGPACAHRLRAAPAGCRMVWGATPRIADPILRRLRARTQLPSVQLVCGVASQVVGTCAALRALQGCPQGPLPGAAGCTCQVCRVWVNRWA